MKDSLKRSCSRLVWKVRGAYQWLELPRWSLLWPVLAVVSAIWVAVLAVLFWFVTVPYYALWPGPVEEASDQVRVEGGPPVHELSGDLYMLTVTLQEVNVFEFAQGWMDSNVDLVARELIRPDDVTPEEHREETLRMMDGSKEAAIAVALTYLDLPYDYTGGGSQVVSVVEGSAADGLIEAGDVIIEVDGTPIFLQEELGEALLSREVGDTVSLIALRGDEEVRIELTLAESSEQPGRPMVGVRHRTHTGSLTAPFEIEIDTHGMGGPSAGLVYALTLIDLLTEEDLLRGNIVAGTGTINVDGTVGPIGGVRQKVVAAQQAGAQHILVPVANYDDAATARWDDVAIHAIADIDQAVAILEALPPR